MNWSLSKLGTFTKCRRRFLYSYIQKLERPRPFAAGRGVDKHKLIEDYFNGKDLVPEFKRYEEWFSLLKQLNPKSENQLAMLEGWLPCEWEDPNVWWKGVLDLLILDGPKAWLFDWKTGKVYPDHEDQKELYTIAVFVSHPEIETIEAWHVYLDLTGKDTKKVYHRSGLEELKRKWDRKLIPYMQALANYSPANAETFFVTNPTYFCDYCPYSKNPCPH